MLIGPSIQYCCFEIKNDVLEHFDSNYYNLSSNNKYKVDLHGWTIAQLVRSGIKKEKLILLINVRIV